MKARAIQEIMNALDVIVSEANSYLAEGSIEEYKQYQSIKMARIQSAADKLMCAVEEFLK